MTKLSLLVALVLASGCDLDTPPHYDGDALTGVRVTGNCPSSEECSSDAPDGLQLRSVNLEALPYITALGGTQTFLIESPDGAPFDLEVAAEVPDSMEVESLSPGQLTIRATETTGPAGAIVNLRDAATGELFDRFRLIIKPVEDVLLLPLRVEGFLAFGSESAFVGSEIAFLSQLNSPDYTDGLLGTISEIMADESLQLTVAPGSVSLFTIDQQSWNSGILNIGNTLGSGTLLLQTGAGDRYEFPLTVVDSVDSIEVLASSTNQVDTPFRLCALPLIPEGYVIGVPLIFTVTGPAELVRENDTCVEVTLTAADPVELTVTGGGATVTFPIEVGE